jgi:putative inorganic carbon (HCO3(-)) transporter
MTFSYPLLMAVSLFGVILAVAGLFYPFLGLVVFFLIYFIQPGELIPALAPFRLELVYGMLLGIVLVVRHSSTPGPSLWSNRIVRGGLVLLGVAALSIPFAVWRGGAFDATISLAKHMALLILIVGLMDSGDRIWKFLWLQAGLMTWFAWTGMHSYLQGDWTIGEHLERAEGINSMAGGPNELAGLLLATLPFVVALIQSARSVLVRSLLIGCAGLAVATMVITGSRISMLGLIVISLYYVFSSRHKLTNLILFLVLASVVWSFIPEKYRLRYATVGQYAEGGELDDSNKLRLEIWKGGWIIFLHDPILGVGAGQFPTAFHNTVGTAHTGWINPHNTLLEVGCELGLLGLGVFGYFVFHVTKGIRFVLRLRDHPTAQANYYLAMACFAMLIGVLMMSMVGHLLYRPYWYLLGGLVAANQLIAETVLRREMASEAQPAEEAEVSELWPTESVEESSDGMPEFEGYRS